MHGPVDDLSFVEVHHLGYGRGEVDVPLFAVLSPDKLNFGGEGHKKLLSCYYAYN